MIRPLPPQIVTGQPPQLLVHQRQELVQSFFVTFTRGYKQLGNLVRLARRHISKLIREPKSWGSVVTTCDHMLLMISVDQFVSQTFGPILRRSLRTRDDAEVRRRLEERDDPPVLLASAPLPAWLSV